MQVEVQPDAVVLRFRPTRPDAVLAWAGKEYRRTTHYRLSVFAASREPGEGDDDVRARLLRAANLTSLPLGRRAHHAVWTRAGDLLELGFTFWRDDDDPDEITEHYSVDLGDVPVALFLEPFGPSSGSRS
jgi:hypothetical protein